jgi:hypothetical protein
MNFYKKITLFSLMCMMWIGAISQTSTISVSGTVTDANNTPVSGATILIWTATDPAWAFNFETFTDDNGVYQVAFTVNAPQGMFNISMICQNNLITYEHIFYDGAIVVQDFSGCSGPGGGCSVNVVADTSNGAIQIVAIPQGVAPFTYLWSNGSTSSSTNPPFFGESCVTITDATGCTSSDCYPDANTSCYVGIAENPGGGLTAVVNANAVTFLWNTGETGIQIFPTTSGNYCVTATFADGCTATQCIFYNGGGSDPCDDVYISVTPVSGTIGANACVVPGNPAANYIYNWSTGETTPCIFVYQDGFYCVTVTNSAGESCEYCQYISINNTGNCGVQIGNDPTNPFYITAYPSGQAPYTYSWSNGATTPGIGINAFGTYCVTITDATGCEAFDCYTYTNDSTTCVVGVVAIQTNTNTYLLYTETPISVPIISWEWSTGETTEEITVTENGQYCVTVTFGNGCQASNCYFITDPGNCSANVSFFNGTPSLIANMTNGTAPYTYLWSTGETTQTILLNSGGIYCCTITDATNCISSDCFWYDPSFGNDSCGVAISAVPVVYGTWELTAYPYGEAPYTYNWSNGITGNSIQYSGDPLVPVCVTVTDANGCTSVSCITLGQVISLNLITGNVFPLTNSAQQTGQVYLIQVTLTQNDILLTAIDTTTFSQNPAGNASYSFEEVPEGCYLIKAALDPGSIGYDGLLPTYFGDAMFWNEASYVCVPNTLSIQYDINLIPGNNPGGPGFIGGLVSEGAGLHEEIDEERGPGDPVAGATVIVTDLNDNPVAYTYTANDGTYGFNNLAWGTYKVWVEVLGLEPVYAIVTIGPDNPSADNINFEANSMELTSIESPDNISAVSLYPNPVNAALFLKMNSEKSGDYQISITDLSGKSIYTQSATAGVGESTLMIPVQHLPSGMYLLNIRNDHQLVTRKFIRQ